MNSPQTPYPTQPGWTAPERYPGPTGRHEAHYSDLAWTAPPVPGPHTIGMPGDPPFGPTAVSGPALPPHPLNAASTGARSPKFRLAVVGGVVTVVVTLAILIAGSLTHGSGGHGFCADAVALSRQYSRQTLAVDVKTHNVAELSNIANEFDTMAAESSSPQDAADLRYTANWIRRLIRGDYTGARAAEPQLAAASDRVNTYIDDTCPGLYVNQG